ncbi:uncharacterized protein LAJ45_10797 [Morchella importuna]|uniref:uncharacterized protein n=1 Tax=Morchella importuna TaxID=1174673 RepID=UPI001E8CDB40|nr:uncharacterized protein LAJ45_10797 [Morchella importuna]KAH8145236.1 hypothetical protein LAJ45_10797 [Morchella importuna]
MEYLEKMIHLGKIRPSKSPAGAPILFVKKKDCSLQLCVDYRGLNRVSIKNRCPLPLMGKLRDRVVGAAIFSKINLKEGYNLIRIKLGDEWKTAFRTRYARYEYLVMPFGLANVPATFQNMMNDVLSEFLHQEVVVYLEDILIYSKSQEEHEQLVGKVLQRLIESNLVANPKKSFFNQMEIEFLGYVLTSSGISMDLDKVMSIKNWVKLWSVKDVQIFMGFANFYRRFIHNFSGIYCNGAISTVWLEGTMPEKSTISESSTAMIKLTPERQLIHERLSCVATKTAGVTKALTKGDCLRSRKHSVTLREAG